MGQLGKLFGKMGAPAKAGTGGSGVGGGTFTPIDLTPALWIDPSDTATMFQLIAGTTAVTDGSVCGYAGDKSGAAFHITSTGDDTTRPLWVDNAALPYLSFDGSNDVLRRAASLGMYAAVGCSVFLTLRGVSSAISTYVISEASSASNNPIFAPVKTSSATATSSDAQIRNDAGVEQVGNTNLVVTNVFDGTDHVFGVTDDGSTLRTYKDGTASTTFAYTRADPVSPTRFGLGALVRAAVGSNWAGRVYGLVIVNRVITSQERADLTTWLGAKAGLTL